MESDDEYDIDQSWDYSFIDNTYVLYNKYNIEEWNKRYYLAIKRDDLDHFTKLFEADFDVIINDFTIMTHLFNLCILANAQTIGKYLYQNHDVNDMTVIRKIMDSAHYIHNMVCIVGVYHHDINIILKKITKTHLRGYDHIDDLSIPLL